MLFENKNTYTLTPLGSRVWATYVEHVHMYSPALTLAHTMFFVRPAPHLMIY